MNKSERLKFRKPEKEVENKHRNFARVEDL
jgi:hypothetical protein